MATVNLGSIKFKWKGTYAGGTAYTIDDVVSYNGSSYICILASTGNLPTNATYFEQMSSAGTNGTNGTDLTTTLTTQGDILYRDGSGLQRLGAGTNGQALLTGGAGANPSWGSVSSDFVLLATANSSTGVQFISIDGYFSATYKNYMLIGVATANDASGGWVYGRYNRSGSTVSSNDYYGSVVSAYNTATSYTSTNPDTYFRIAQLGSAAAKSSSFTMTIYNPLGTDKYKQTSWYGIGEDGNSAGFHSFAGGGILRDSTSAISGLNFYDSSVSSSFQMDIKLYGIK